MLACESNTVPDIVGMLVGFLMGGHGKERSLSRKFILQVLTFSLIHCYEVVLFLHPQNGRLLIL